MRLLLTSAGIKNPSIHEALVDLLGKPIAESNALCIPTAGYGSLYGQSRRGMAFHQRSVRPAHVRAGLEVTGSAGAHRAAQHRQGTLGPVGPGDGRPAGERRGRPVPGPLDARVRAGGPPAVAARDGVGGIQRREHGPDPPRSARTSSGGSRPPVATARWGSSTSRSSRTWITPICRRTPWPKQRDGPPACRGRRTRSTTTLPSKSATAPSKSSPRGTGNCSPARTAWDTAAVRSAGRSGALRPSSRLASRPGRAQCPGRRRRTAARPGRGRRGR